MSEVFSTVQPILMLQLTDINGHPVVVNSENILYHHVLEESGTQITFIGGEVITVEEKLTVEWLRTNAG